LWDLKLSKKKGLEKVHLIVGKKFFK